MLCCHHSSIFSGEFNSEEENVKHLSQKPTSPFGSSWPRGSLFPNLQSTSSQKTETKKKEGHHNYIQENMAEYAQEVTYHHSKEHEFMYLPTTLQYFALSMKNRIQARKERKKKKEPKNHSSILKKFKEWSIHTRMASAGNSKEGGGTSGGKPGSGSTGGSGGPSGRGASSGDPGRGGASSGAGGASSGAGGGPPGPPHPPGGPHSGPPGEDGDEDDDEEKEKCDAGGQFQEYPARGSNKMIKVYSSLPDNPTPNYLYRVFDAGFHSINDGSSWKPNETFNRNAKQSRRQVAWSKIRGFLRKGRNTVPSSFSNYQLEMEFYCDRRALGCKSRKYITEKKKTLKTGDFIRGVIYKHRHNHVNTGVTADHNIDSHSQTRNEGTDIGIEDNSSKVQIEDMGPDMDADKNPPPDQLESLQGEIQTSVSINRSSSPGTGALVQDENQDTNMNSPAGSNPSPLGSFFSNLSLSPERRTEKLPDYCQEGREQNVAPPVQLPPSLQPGPPPFVQPDTKMIGGDALKNKPKLVDYDDYQSDTDTDTDLISTECPQESFRLPSSAKEPLPSQVSPSNLATLISPGKDDNQVITPHSAPHIMTASMGGRPGPLSQSMAQVEAIVKVIQDPEVNQVSPSNLATLSTPGQDDNLQTEPEPEDLGPCIQMDTNSKQRAIYTSSEELPPVSVPLMDPDKYQYVCRMCSKVLKDSEIPRHLLIQHYEYFTEKFDFPVPEKIDGEFKCPNCPDSKSSKYGILAHFVKEHLKQKFIDEQMNPLIKIMELSQPLQSSKDLSGNKNQESENENEQGQEKGKGKGKGKSNFKGKGKASPSNQSMPDSIDQVHVHKQIINIIAASLIIQVSF